MTTPTPAAPAGASGHDFAGALPGAIASVSTENPVILVVDDEPDLEQLLRLKFRRKLRKKQLTMYFAANGEEALEQLAAHPDIEVVVTDINMPRMDGLSLVHALRHKYPTVKAVIVSAYGDMSNIRGAMNRGAFDFLTKPLDFRDFEATVNKTLEHVRTLRATLRSLEENRILKLFVDEAAVHFMLKHQGDEDGEDETRIEQEERAVAFIDICGFTTIAEEAPPTVVVGLLNRYFDTIVAAVHPYGGNIDKFIGDAVMVTFKGPDHKQRAVQACLAVREAIRKEAEKDSDLDYLPEVSIGLNAGLVVVGPVGAKSLNRLDFTVVGDVVNTAARLQSHAGPGQLAVTGGYLEGVGDLPLKLVEAGETVFKGKSASVKVFMVTGEDDDSGADG
jgi:class 3 adenylate cyclase